MSEILVTGAKGFLGSALLAQLQSQGMKVYGIDVEQGDITLEDTLKPYEIKNITHVVHLAGKTFVPESWEHPFSFYQVNVMGTLNVLEFCRRTKASLTYISSYLYGEPESLPISENHPVKSYNPYSHSKVLAENACDFYSRAYGLKIVILRPFNAFGPGQPSRFIIPEIIERVKDPEVKVVEVMDLRPRRDYIFISDLTNAIRLSIHAPSGIFNLGSGYSVSVEEIIREVMEITGIHKEYRSRGTERPNEIFDLYADISRAKRELQWEPMIRFEEGLAQCLRT